MNVQNDPDRGERKFDRSGVDFIKVELRLARTLMQVAATERSLGDGPAAEKAVALARHAYANFNRFCPAVEKHLTAAEHSEIKQLQKEVEELMSAV